MSERKFWDIDHPPVVVVTGEVAFDPSGESRQVERVPKERAAERVGERPAVECLWVADAVEADRPLAEAAREADPATTVVFAGADRDPSLAVDATAAGAEYVHPGAGEEERRERLETALERGVDRHHDTGKRSVFDAIADGLDVSVYAKDAAARLVLYGGSEGSPAEDAVFGLTDREIYPEQGGDRSYADDRRVIDDGVPLDGRAKLVGDRWLWTVKAPWDDGGERRGLVGATFDITESKVEERRLIQQVARLQQIPDFVNHDLKNDLNVAQGYLELARGGHEGALDTVAEALDRVEAIFDDFHTLASNGFEDTGTREVLPFRPLVDEAWGYVGTPSTALDLDVPSGTTLVASESGARPVLKNLLGNAVDHAGGAEPAEGATVRVGLLENGDGFYVEDDGPGIPEEERHRVFEQGYTTSEDNTGLGLAIVREIARLEGWDITVAEGELGGARFEIDACQTASPVIDVTPVGETLELTGSADVGEPERPGETAGGDGTYTLTAAGEDVWADTNEFHFAYVPVEGDARIVARIGAIGEVGEWTKAGVMVRSGLEPPATYGFAGLLAANRVPEVGWRTDAGAMGHSDYIEGEGGTHDWFRIERVGDELCCSISADGEEWTPVDRRTVELGDTAWFGIFACSTVAGETTRAEFDGVSVRTLD